MRRVASGHPSRRRFAPPQDEGCRRFHRGLPNWKRGAEMIPGSSLLVEQVVLSDQNTFALEHFASPKACANYLVKHTLYRFQVER